MPPRPQQPQPSSRQPADDLTHRKVRAACLLREFAKSDADHDCTLHLMPGDAIPPAWRSTFALHEWATQRNYIVVYGEYSRTFDVLPASEAVPEPRDEEHWTRALWCEVEARRQHEATV